MDTFEENYIKQEPNSIEDEFITFKPPNVATVMPVNTEPFFNEHGTLVTVKNEPISDDGFLNTIRPLMAPVFNEIGNTSNTTSPLANIFAVNKLDAQKNSNFYLQDNNKIQNVPIITPKSQTVPPPRLLNVNNKSKTTKCHPTPARRTVVSSERLQKRSLGTLLKEALASTSMSSKSDHLNPKVNAETNKILNSRQINKSPQPESTLVSKMLAIKPVLLNTQLRKRSKFNGNTKTETILPNKQVCYSKEGFLYDKVYKKPSEPASKLDSKNTYVEISPKTYSGESVKSELKEIYNAKDANKKIINYIMQRKRVERIKKSRLNQTSTRGEPSESGLSSSINNIVTSSPCSKINFQNQQNPHDIVVKTEQLDDDKSVTKNTVIKCTTIPKETNTEYPSSSLMIPKASLNTSESVPIKEESVKSKTLHHRNTIQMPELSTYSPSPFPVTPVTTSESIGKILNSKIVTYPFPVTPITTSESIGKIVNSKIVTYSKTHSEIKVKCLCRLAGESTSDEPPSTSKKEDLKNFFHNMFQETRRLTKQQQRTVKMSLLQAICKAEEMVENGKCCCF